MPATRLQDEWNRGMVWQHGRPAKPNEAGRSHFLILAVPP